MNSKSNVSHSNLKTTAKVCELRGTRKRMSKNDKQEISYSGCKKISSNITDSEIVAGPSGIHTSQKIATSSNKGFNEERRDKTVKASVKPKMKLSPSLKSFTDGSSSEKGCEAPTLLLDCFKTKAVLGKVIKFLL